jgi:peptidoglycan/LPS O-acetylase OafA/YrhL
MLPARMAAVPSPALAPPPGNPRFPLLDSLRAIAAFAIVFTHTASVVDFNTDNWLGQFTARLNIGVALFFLLSGFLLYRPFVAARYEGRPPVRLRDYTRRRVLRIVPAYWVALTLLALWPGLVAFWDGPWWRSYAFTQIYFREGIISQGIFPAWTLCIEVTFYLALPFLAAAIGRIAGRRVKVDLALLAALFVACNALRIVLQASGGGYILQNTLLCYLDWFAVGMAMAVVSVAMWGRERDSRVLRTIVERPWTTWALAAVGFYVVSTQLGLSRTFFGYFSQTGYHGEHLLFVAVSALVMLPAVFGDAHRTPIRRLLAWRWLAWLGLISYGVFLYHGPFVLWLAGQEADQWIPGSGYLSMTGVACAMSIAAAALSFYLVERPVLRFKDRGSRRSSRSRALERSAPDESAATARQAPALPGSRPAASRASSSA